jgi:protein-disulfide isomerase
LKSSSKIRPKNKGPSFASERDELRIGRRKSTRQKEKNVTLIPPVSEHEHLRGNLDAPIILVHYGDFECPYSGAAYWAVKEVVEHLGEQLCYVFRPFPLHDIHPHAMHAAEAAEAAAAQNRFWPMYELLFENQEELGAEEIVSYANQAGLDEARFAEELKARVHHESVLRSIAGGRKNGVKGTPTFFINGVFHGNREGLWDAEALLEAIENTHSG